MRTIESLENEIANLRMQHTQHCKNGRWIPAQKTREKLIERLNQLSRLSDSGAIDLAKEVVSQAQERIHELLSECGCAFGDEHRRFTIEERIKALARERDFYKRERDGKNS